MKFRWKMPPNIHWEFPMEIHWKSDNPLENTPNNEIPLENATDNPLENATENPELFLRCLFLACDLLPLVSVVRSSRRRLALVVC